MSNEEKRRRELYRKKRKKWILIQSIIILAVALLSAFSFYTYSKLNETHYVNYTEKSSVNYSATLKDNEYLDKEQNDEKNAYVTGMLESLKVKFNYELAIEAEEITYDYSYKITTQLLVIDKTSNKPIIDETEKNEEVLNQKGAIALLLSDVINVHFAEYNDYVSKFVKGNNLTNTESKLVVSMDINVLSKCAKFEDIENNQHVMSLNIPLNKETVDIQKQNNTPTGTTKILACKTGMNNGMFKIIGFVGVGVDALLAIFLVGFIYLTRTLDIDYENKVRKIITNYKSYIQRIQKPFNTTGYQVVTVSTFNELLEIRDTVQKPILVNENEDKTRSTFVIPNDSILYLYDLKVDNYDELYPNNDVEEVVEQPVDEPIVSEETIEEVNETEVEEINETFDEEVEETTESASNIRYNYSFEAKLTLADYQTKLYYENIIKFVTMYNIKVVRSWKKEKIYFGRKTYANLVFRGSKLCVALALNPKDYENSKYRYIDVSNIKRFENTPMMMKLTSDRKQKHTLELLELIFDSNDVGNATKPYQFKKIPYKSKQSLIKSGLIKTNIKEPQEV